MTHFQGPFTSPPALPVLLSVLRTLPELAYLEQWHPLLCDLLGLVSLAICVETQIVGPGQSPCRWTRVALCLFVSSC